MVVVVVLLLRCLIYVFQFYCVREFIPWFKNSNLDFCSGTNTSRSRGCPTIHDSFAISAQTPPRHFAYHLSMAIAPKDSGVLVEAIASVSDQISSRGTTVRELGEYIGLFEWAVFGRMRHLKVLMLFGT